MQNQLNSFILINCEMRVKSVETKCPSYHLSYDGMTSLEGMRLFFFKMAELLILDIKLIIFNYYLS